MSTVTSRKSALIALGATVVLIASFVVGAATLGAAPAAPKVFLANLNSAQETPPVATSGQGNAFLTYDQSTKTLCYSIVVSGLGSAEILAHIHGPALPGVPAGIQIPLAVGASKSGCVGPLTATQQKDLLKNLWYINIHTVGFPGGEIRGQILRIK